MYHVASLGIHDPIDKSIVNRNIDYDKSHKEPSPVVVFEWNYNLAIDQQSISYHSNSGNSSLPSTVLFSVTGRSKVLLICEKSFH